MAYPTMITVTTANGAVYYVRGPEDDTDSRQHAFEWAVRNIAYGGPDHEQFLQLRGYRFARHLLNREQIVTIAIGLQSEEIDTELHWVLD